MARVLMEHYLAIQWHAGVDGVVARETWDFYAIVARTAQARRLCKHLVGLLRPQK